MEGEAVRRWMRHVCRQPALVWRLAVTSSSSSGCVPLPRLLPVALHAPSLSLFLPWRGQAAGVSLSIPVGGSLSLSLSLCFLLDDGQLSSRLPLFLFVPPLAFLLRNVALRTHLCLRFRPSPVIFPSQLSFPLSLSLSLSVSCCSVALLSPPLLRPAPVNALTVRIHSRAEKVCSPERARV